jgi:excisionase family DNA binding protein
MSEILKVEEVAELLKFSKRQVYELTRDRVRSVAKHPIPFIKINGNLRFRRVDIMEWIATLAQEVA